MTRPLEIRLDAADPGATRERVTRFDTYRFDKAERMADGSYRVDAVVTKSGVFTYHDELTGDPILEYRPPEEVLHVDSMASLKDKTVTVLHPPGLVNADNWKQYAVGHVSGESTGVDGAILAKLIVSDQAAIKGIQAGSIKEISCGYELYTDNTPGTTPSGQRYDKIQRGIQYNHVAMGPEGWGRQGSGVSLRLDSKGNQVIHNDTGDRTMKIKIHFDGQTYEVEAGSAEHNALLGRIAAKDAADKAASIQAEADKKAAVTEKARADAAEAARVELQKKLDAAPAEAIKVARERLTLEGQAVKVLGSDFKFDGADGKPLKDRDIHVAALAKLEPEFKADGKDDVYVRAYFDSVQTRTTSQSPQERMLLDSRGDGGGGGSSYRADAAWYREDGTIKLDEDDVNYYDACVAKRRRDAKDAYKRPLSVYVGREARA